MDNHKIIMPEGRVINLVPPKMHDDEAREIADARVEEIMGNILLELSYSIGTSDDYLGEIEAIRQAVKRLVYLSYKIGD